MHPSSERVSDIRYQLTKFGVLPNPVEFGVIGIVVQIIDGKVWEILIDHGFKVLYCSICFAHSGVRLKPKIVPYLRPDFFRGCEEPLNITISIQ